jgi:hypothetical protein
LSFLVNIVTVTVLLNTEFKKKKRMAKGLKDPCPHVAGVGGQYKMYNSLIFINFISRSKKVKPKMLTCV